MSVLPAVRAAIHGVDADLPMSTVSSMDDLIEASTGPRRFSMFLLGGFSVLAMCLASVGLYGVMSYLVTQRAKELGVRLALGARSQDVLRMVLRQGMTLAALGLGIGLVAALVITRLIRGMLFDVSTTDPVTFLLISLLLMVVTLVATFIPAHRATQVDPITALREE